MDIWEDYFVYVNADLVELLESVNFDYSDPYINNRIPALLINWLKTNRVDKPKEIKYNVCGDIEAAACEITGLVRPCRVVQISRRWK